MAALLTIRKAGHKDIPHLMDTISRTRVMGNSAPSSYFRWVIQEGIVLIAENEERTQGFLIAEKNNKIAYAQLIYLFVHPPFRNKSVGSILMDHFLRTCHKKGVKYIDVHSHADAVNFYEKCGFTPEGNFTTMYKKI